MIISKNTPSLGMKVFKLKQWILLWLRKIFILVILNSHINVLRYMRISTLLLQSEDLLLTYMYIETKSIVYAIFQSGQGCRFNSFQIHWIWQELPQKPEAESR